MRARERRYERRMLITRCTCRAAERVRKDRAIQRHYTDDAATAKEPSVAMCAARRRDAHDDA